MAVLRSSTTELTRTEMGHCHPHGLTYEEEAKYPQNIESEYKPTTYVAPIYSAPAHKSPAFTARPAYKVLVVYQCMPSCRLCCSHTCRSRYPCLWSLDQHRIRLVNKRCPYIHCCSGLLCPGLSYFSLRCPKNRCSYPELEFHQQVLSNLNGNRRCKPLSLFKLFIVCPSYALMYWVFY